MLDNCTLIISLVRFVMFAVKRAENIYRFNLLTSNDHALWTYTQAKTGNHE